MNKNLVWCNSNMLFGLHSIQNSQTKIVSIVQGKYPCLLKAKWEALPSKLFEINVLHWIISGGERGDWYNQTTSYKLMLFLKEKIIFSSLQPPFLENIIHFKNIKSDNLQPNFYWGCSNFNTYISVKNRRTNQIRTFGGS